ncbi:MAG TPA: hypothetical protein ENK18_03080 [Deltaproteobacteria bacterium]|nr:hypothetical protein [Deltaproteobacteria bacterium]
MPWSLIIASALGAPAPHLVLVSLDTTRADALSCYGAQPRPAQGAAQTTPVLDALAADGLRLERFYANAPSTLSSHATMLTGLDPHGHSVVRNGYPLGPPPTLAERLQGEGYDTIAVVGAAALESAMGLDRGFRIYDDEVLSLRGLMYQDTADGVVRRALTAVDARRPDAPLFLLVHFYDPHTPYVPPEPYVRAVTDPGYRGGVTGDGPRFKRLAQAVRSGGARREDVQHVDELYLAEVAFVDAQIGLLLDGLRRRGLLEHSLVVVVADHGETLGDDPIYAWSHGSNVAHEVMWVPLIMRGYGMPLARHAVVQRQASMDGLAPTLEIALGLQPTLGTGLPFYDLLRAGPALDRDGWPDRPTLPVRVEATRPRRAEVAEGWNNLALYRGIWAGGWGAFAAPFIDRPLTFYDQGAPPDPGILGELGLMLEAWDAAAPPHVEAQMAPATRRALEALGYLE